MLVCVIASKQQQQQTEEQMKINTAVEENATGNIPNTNVLLRVKKPAEFKLSDASGTKMLVVLLEVSEPTEVTNASGSVVPVAGLELTNYLPYEGGGAFRFAQFCQALRDSGNDVPVDMDFDDETGLPVGVDFTGMQLWAVIATEVQESKIGKGKDATALLNPLTGKPQVMSRLAIKRFITAKS